MSDVKYLGCVWDESGTEVAQCCRRVASGRKPAVAISWSLVIARGL